MLLRLAVASFATHVVALTSSDQTASSGGEDEAEIARRKQAEAAARHKPAVAKANPLLTRVWGVAALDGDEAASDKLAKLKAQRAEVESGLAIEQKKKGSLEGLAGTFAAMGSSGQASPIEKEVADCARAIEVLTAALATIDADTAALDAASPTVASQSSSSSSRRGSKRSSRSKRGQAAEPAPSGAAPVPSGASVRAASARSGGGGGGSRRHHRHSKRDSAAEPAKGAVDAKRKKKKKRK